MRCSSCEPLLDRYVEGTLSPRDMRRVHTHLQSCADCEALVTELRVVDALLETTKPVELAPNFTFAVMAEVRATPARRTRTVPVWGVLSFYLVAAWIVLSSLLVFGRRGALLGVLRDTVFSPLTHAAAAIGGASHAISPAAPVVFAGVAGVLVIDAILLGAIILFYRNVRPRLSARIVPPEAV